MSRRVIKKAKQIIIAILGLLVVCLGIILLFYPGPGWLVIFAGLAILAVEFESISRLLEYGRKIYDEWQAWISAQKLSIKIAFALITAISATLMTWLLNGFGLINYIFNLNIDWLISPLIKLL